MSDTCDGEPVERLPALGPHWLAEEAPWNQPEAYYDDDQKPDPPSRWSAYKAPWEQQ